MAATYEPASVDDLVHSDLSPKQIEGMVVRIAQEQGVNPDLALRVARQESGFNPFAVSKQGARGVMQLMPGTARDMGVADVHDPEQNITGGVKYLALLDKQFQGDEAKVRAAYHSGPETVAQGGIEALGPKGRDYVEKTAPNRGSQIASELKAKKAATYEPMTFGGQPEARVTYAPMFPEEPKPAPVKTSSPIKDTVSELGRSIWEGLTVHTPASVAAAYQGMDISDEGFGGYLIAKSQELQKQRATEPGGDLPSAIPGIKMKDLREFGQNLGFSMVAMGAGLAAGIPSTVVGSLATPAVGTVAGYGAGMAAAGKAGYNMDVNQVTRQLKESADEESLAKTGKKLDPAEWQAKLDSMKGDIQKHGLYEAIPEAMGAGAGFAILTTAAKVFGKAVIARFATKLGAMYGEEMLTETVTQIGQQAAETRMGLHPGEEERSFTSWKDWADSAKEVAPQIFLLTTLTAGAGKLAHMGYQATQKQAPGTPPGPPGAPIPPATTPAPTEPGPPAGGPPEQATAAVEAGPPAIAGKDLPLLYPGSPTYTWGQGIPPEGGPPGGAYPNIDSEGRKYRDFTSGGVQYDSEIVSPFFPNRVYAPDTPQDPNFRPAGPAAIAPIDQARIDAQVLKEGRDLGLMPGDPRMKNAELVRIYGENAAVRHVIEAPGQFSALGDAMLMAAPAVERVRANSRAQKDVAEDIVGAIDAVTQINDTNGLAEILAEGVGSDLSHEAIQLAQFIHENRNNPERIASMTESVLHNVEMNGGPPSLVRGRVFENLEKLRAENETMESLKNEKIPPGLQIEGIGNAKRAHLETSQLVNRLNSLIKCMRSS